jgi:DNA (cytosine-5)-methyltransferase 1
MKRHIIRFIDLFCGAGGLAQGFRQACDDHVEFRSVFAVEIEPVFAASYVANFGDHVFVGAIENLKEQDIPSADLVIGGPPCQGFSNLGKVSPTDRHAKLNKLFRYYFKVIEWVQPLAFVVENVPEFLSSLEFQEALRKARHLGYITDFAVLNAADFGVPQLRRRGFLIGTRRGTPRLPRAATRRGETTVRDAIYDLIGKPLIFDFKNGRMENGKYVSHDVETLHIGRRPTPKSLERYMTIPPGGNRFTLMKLRPDITPGCWFRKKSGATDVMGRLEWGKPALTIRTEFFKPEKGRYLHPEHHRPITHWEAARIQTFPDSYKFCGSKIEIARQIGNAVPPKLAEAVAQEVKQLFLRRKSEQQHLAALRSAEGQVLFQGCPLFNQVC